MNKLAVIGLGYVGLPLAVEFGKVMDVIGFDIDEIRINELRVFNDRTGETEMRAIEASKRLVFTTNVQDLRDASIYIVTVPTPVDEFKQPDLAPLRAASKTVGSTMKKGDLIIYESTVFPGCTEEVCVPILEQSSGL